LNPEKKLEYFAETITREVEGKKQKARRQMAEDMNTAVSHAASEAEAWAERHILAEHQTLQKTTNKRISEAQTHARRSLAALQEELTAKLLGGVTADISAFTASPEYEGYLIAGIQAAVAGSKYSFIYIQLTPSDMRLANAVQEATGLIPEAGTGSDIGGFKLLTANRRMAADFTFKSRLEDTAEEFNESIASSTPE